MSIVSLKHLSCLCLAGLLVITGCAVGPQYKAQRPAAPESFEGFSTTYYSTNEISLDWWRGFHDPQLESLVARALTNNHDLRIARATLLEARALRRSSQFDFLPAPRGIAGYTDTELSKAALGGFPVHNRETELYDVGFDATWELDVFGRVRRAVEASSAEVDAAEANLRDVQVSLISEIARNYLELRGAQNQLAVARKNAENAGQTLNITKARLEAGRGTDLDTSRAAAQLNNTLAAIPPLETEVARALHRLSVLIGQQPAALSSDLNKPAPIPAQPKLVAISSPEALLRRRADLRVAERRLASATARIGVATADLFPRVTFNGRVALEASTISGLGKGGSDAYSFGPQITWAALDLGHVRARIKAADARAEAALAVYERTVLTTLEETENALVNYGRENARAEFLKASVQASENAAALARVRFENGAADFLTVLDAERVLLAARDQFAQSQTRSATALVAVYKALGGGW